MHVIQSDLQAQAENFHINDCPQRSDLSLFFTVPLIGQNAY